MHLPAVMPVEGRGIKVIVFDSNRPIYHTSLNDAEQVRAAPRAGTAFEPQPKRQANGSTRPCPTGPRHGRPVRRSGCKAGRSRQP